MKIVRRGEKAWVLYWELGRTPEGTRRQKTETFHGTRRDAEKRWREVQAQLIDSNILADPGRMTFGELLDRWLKDVAALRVRPTTLESYRVLIKKHIAPALGSVLLSKLRPPRLNAFYRERLEAGLSPRSVRYLHTIIRAALGQAEKWGFVPRNVAALASPPAAKAHEMRIWNAEEITRFLQAARDDRLFALFYLAVVTGLRKGELLALSLGDLELGAEDDAGGVINVRRSLTRIGGGIIWQEPKSARGRRRVDIGPDAVAVLRDHLAAVEELRRKAGPYWQERGLLFPTGLGTPHEPRNVTRSFDRIIQRAGLPKIRFHDLRHCHASLLLAQGENPRLISERLGHSQVSFTLQTYSHLLPGAQEKAARRLEERLRWGEAEE